VDEEFDDVGTVTLIGWRGQIDLNGPYDSQS
jgi:hypothetical protein